MALDTKRATTIHERVATPPGPTRRSVAPWVWVATAVAVVAIAVSAFSIWQGRQERPGGTVTVPVYLDPMTSAREGGPYVNTTTPASFPDPMTAVREGGPYASPIPATDTSPDAMTSAREGGPYLQTGSER